MWFFHSKAQRILLIQRFNLQSSSGESKRKTKIKFGKIRTTNVFNFFQKWKLMMMKQTAQKISSKQCELVSLWSFCGSSGYDESGCRSMVHV